jgi:hypothetical protein
LPANRIARAANAVIVRTANGNLLVKPVMSQIIAIFGAGQQRVSVTIAVVTKYMSLYERGLKISVC